MHYLCYKCSKWPFWRLNTISHDFAPTVGNPFCSTGKDIMIITEGTKACVFKHQLSKIGKKLSYI